MQGFLQKFSSVPRGMQCFGVLGLLYGVMLIIIDSYILNKKPLLIHQYFPNCEGNCTKNLSYLISAFCITQLFEGCIFIPTSLMQLCGVGMGRLWFVLPYFIWMELSIVSVFFFIINGLLLGIKHGSSFASIIILTIVCSLINGLIKVYFLFVLNWRKKKIKTENTDIVMPTMSYEIPGNPSLYSMHQMPTYNPGYSGNMFHQPEIARPEYCIPGYSRNAINPLGHSVHVYYVSGYDTNAKMGKHT